MKHCTINACNGKHAARGLCPKHYQQWRKTDGKNAIVRKTKSHGLSNTRLYTTWVHIKQRTTDPNIPGYENYGGRGIKMCQGWIESFVLFYEMVGERPDISYSIDRIDNDKGYTCGKCQDCIENNQVFNIRWATRKQQTYNRRLVKRNTTGYRGVHLYRKSYIAMITHDNKHDYLGSFSTAIEAARAYNEAAIKYRGSDALLNDI